MIPRIFIQAAIKKIKQEQRELIRVEKDRERERKKKHKFFRPLFQADIANLPKFEPPVAPAVPAAVEAMVFGPDEVTIDDDDPPSGPNDPNGCCVGGGFGNPAIIASAL